MKLSYWYGDKYGKIIEMPRVLPDSYKTIKILSEIQNTIINCKEDRIVLDFQNCILVMLCLHHL